MKDDFPNLGQPHVHTMQIPQVDDTPNAICPLCGKDMSVTGSFYAGVIECTIYTWHCPKCHIKRAQAHDASWFNPQQWHRVHYNFGDNKDVFEDEEGFAERVKAEQEKRGLKPVRIDTPPGDNVLPSMTREEAVIDLKAKITRIKAILDDGLCANLDRWAIKLKWHEDMLAALHSHQPDPITGLVPCGCGKAPESRFCDYGSKTGRKNGSGNAIKSKPYLVGCTKCRVYVSIFSTEAKNAGYKNARDYAIAKWNCAMGYQEADE